jgi:hypothetical protein
MFSYISAERRVSKNHPLRAIRVMVDEALKESSWRFDTIYANSRRPPIAPEKLLRAPLLQVPYPVASIATSKSSRPSSNSPHTAIASGTLAKYGSPVQHPAILVNHRDHMGFRTYIDARNSSHVESPPAYRIYPDLGASIPAQACAYEDASGASGYRSSSRICGRGRQSLARGLLASTQRGATPPDECA